MQRVPRFAHSDAEDACFLAAGYGLKLDPWQELVLTAWLGRTRDGRLASGRCGLAVPRQNGKNAVIEVRELFGMVYLGERFLHTAHEVKTARKAFLRLKHFFGEQANDPAAKFPELNALVREVRSTNGQEAIVLHNGGSVELVARSRGSARGFTVDVLVLDEAQELTDEQLEALQPTISAAPLGDPQTILTGTPPGPNSPGEVFGRMRASAATVKSFPRKSWHEWSVTGSADIYDRQNWAKTNPGLGYRLRESTVADELPPTMSVAGFLRERLGKWDEAGENAGPFGQSWVRGIDDDSRIAADSPRAFGLDVSVDRDRAFVAVAGRREDGAAHVEVIHTRAGLGWVKGWLGERCSPDKPMRLALQWRGAPVSSLIDDLSKVPGLELVPWEGAGLTTGTALLLDTAKASALDPDGKRSGLVHLTQPALDVAAGSAAVKVLESGGMLLDRKRSTSDIAPLVAVCAALWLLHQEPKVFRSAYESRGVETI